MDEIKQHRMKAVMQVLFQRDVDDACEWMALVDTNTARNGAHVD